MLRSKRLKKKLLKRPKRKRLLVGQLFSLSKKKKIEQLKQKVQEELQN